MTETTDETETRRRARRALLEIGARWAAAKRRGHAASLSGDAPGGGETPLTETSPPSETPPPSASAVSIR